MAAKGLWEFRRSAVAEFKDGTRTYRTASQATQQVEGNIVQATTPL